ncbi:hypothetical protein C7B80_05350 [Cyanosarcina cf. burmensis CCALA 770]|jgi:hypothetical protein|nr:hypothetical protein C7B80_05350 [Cyanosarcina cf. burmensis CCALA 770]
MDKSNTSTGFEYNLLTWQQQQAIDLLLLGLSQELIADRLQIDRETLECWCANDESNFAASLKSRRQEWRNDMTSLKDLHDRSLERLKQELEDNDSFQKEEVRQAFNRIEFLSLYNYLRITEQSA